MANAIVERFATFSSAVTRASELKKRATALRFGLLCPVEAKPRCLLGWMWEHLLG